MTQQVKGGNCMSKWIPRLSEQLKNMEALFSAGELAYLALTQKVEHVLRDKLAFALHCRWAEKESLLVCREWNRVDLAVLDATTVPVFLLEAKAQYTFDIIKKGVDHDYPELLRQDVRKLIPRRHEQTEVFTILFATHAWSVPDKKYREAIKYFPGLARYAGTSSMSEINDRISQRLVDHPIASHGQIDGGEAFGIPVCVAYWLFGPYSHAV